MLRNELEQEIKKWTRRLNSKLSNARSVDEHGDNLIENAEAYRKDSEHFFQKDPIKSFECLIWAWR